MPGLSPGEAEDRARGAAFNDWLQAAVDGRGPTPRSRFINSRLDRPSSGVLRPQHHGRRGNSRVDVGAIGDGLSSSSVSDHTSSSSENEDDDNQDDDSVGNGSSGGSFPGVVDLTGGSDGSDGEDDDGGDCDHNGRAQRRRPRRRGCCGCVESVLLWAFVAVFMTAALYGALQHNFFRTYFPRDHAVNEFVRRYHATVSRVFPFARWGYVMFAYRQPPEFTFTGFHVVDPIPNGATALLPPVEDQFFSISLLQPTTSLYYEDSRVWIDERKFLGRRGDSQQNNANDYYRTLCEQYFLGNRHLEETCRPGTGGTLLVEHRSVLLPLSASTPEAPTHPWPYVVRREFRVCTFNREADRSKAVSVTVRKDLRVEGPAAGVAPRPVKEWQSHFLRPATPPSTELKYNVANSVIALCFGSVLYLLVKLKQLSAAASPRRRDAIRAGVMLRVFSKLIYAGAIVHFLPKLWEFDINFDASHFFANMDASRQWNPTVKDAFDNDRIPMWALHALRWATVSFLALGFFGVGVADPQTQASDTPSQEWIPRIVALGSYFCLFVIASINSFQLQTLALLILWAVLPCMAVLHHRPRMLRGVLLFYFLFGTLAAGVEKVHSDWPGTNPMHSFLRIPSLVREPLVPWLLRALPEHATMGMTLASMASEVAIPALGALGALLGWKRAAHIAAAANLLFFTGVVSMMSVPPLFWFGYGAGVSALLCL